MPLNLLRGLQSEHTATRREQWRRWRLAAVLTAVAVVLGFSTYGLHIYRMQQQLAALDAQNLSLFSELFPEQNNVDAVSYTHLDVYKRQAHHLLRLFGGGSFGAGLPHTGRRTRGSSAACRWFATCCRSAAGV